jgi:hypothetical protein
LRAPGVLEVELGIGEEVIALGTGVRFRVAEIGTEQGVGVSVVGVEIVIDVIPVVLD